MFVRLVMCSDNIQKTPTATKPEDGYRNYSHKYPHLTPLSAKKYR
jgi:hypothetical protein